jgi:excisionase family DNA binding protein
LTVPEAAARLGLSVDTVYRHCEAGTFAPAIKIGRQWRISSPKLERMLHGDALTI